MKPRKFRIDGEECVMPVDQVGSRQEASVCLLPLDAPTACWMVNSELQSWKERWAVMADGWERQLALDEQPRRFRDIADRFAVPPDALEVISGYERRRRQEKKEHDAELRRHGLFGLSDDHYKDERPYFQDPVKLLFDPKEAMLRNDKREHEGVSFKRLWRDPLARTLWLAMKGRFLTDQHFRKGCLIQARDIRNGPRKTADDLHVSVNPRGFSFGLPYWYRVQLYPYVVRLLIDEGRWPYFEPPRLPQHPLGWVIAARAA